MAFWDELNKGVTQVSDVLQKGVAAWNSVTGAATPTKQTTTATQTAAVNTDPVQGTSTTAVAAKASSGGLLLVGALIVAMLLLKGK